MADNIFAQSPVEVATARADQRTRGVLDAMQPSAPQESSPSMDFDMLARRTQVPQNIIEAAHELAGSEGVDADSFANGFSWAVGQQIEAGSSVKDAVQAVFEGNQQVADAVLQRAVQLVPAPEVSEPESGPEEDGSVAGDLARRAGSSVLRGLGASVEGMGQGFNRDTGLRTTVTTGPDGEPIVEHHMSDETPEMIENTREAGNYLRDTGKDIAKGISADAQEAMQKSQFKGDLFKPSTWELPEDSSVEGLAHLTVEVLGSMAPVIVASIVTRKPVVGAAVGGSQSAGAGAEDARKEIQKAAQDVDADGVSRLERESPYYRDLIAQGKSPEEATRITSDAAVRTAAGWAAIPGAIGGAATGRILQKPLASLASRNAAVRIGGTAAVSAVEEGAQEVAEKVAGRAGVESATGLDVDLTEGTVNDFVLGAMGGGPVGAAAGIRRDQNAGNARDLSRALDAAEPAEASALPMQDDATTMHVDDAGNPIAAPEPVQPKGPLARAAELAPEPVEAPAPLATQSMVSGSRVRLDVPGGKPIEAVFKEETDAGMLFEQDGNPFLVLREEIEAGKVSFSQINPITEAQTEAPSPDVTPTEEFDPDTGEILSPAEPVAQPVQQHQPKKPAKPTLQKRPFTAALKANTRGIDPAGPLGQDLQHRGVTPQTAPGLFRKGGAQSLDNLPAAEWAEYATLVGEDGNGYLSEQGIVDALAEELAGKPVQGREQMELQAEADVKAELQELREMGVDLDESGAETITPEQAETDRIVPPRSDMDDFTMGQDRAEMIWRDVRTVELDLGVELSAAERRTVFDKLNENGGSVEDALWSQLEKEPDEYAEPSHSAVQDPGPPFTESELSAASEPEGAGAEQPGSERSEGDTGSESESGTRPDDVERAGSETQPEPDPVDPAPELQDSWWRSLPKTRHAAKRLGMSKADLGDTWTDKDALVSAVNAELQKRGHTDLAAPEPEQTDPIEDKFAANRKVLKNFKKGDRVEYTNNHFDPPRVFRGAVVKVLSKQQGTIELLMDGGRNGNGYDVSIGASALRHETPATEQTPEGEQTLIPGVEPVKDKDRAEAQMAMPKRGGDAAMPEGGLFDEGVRNQTDLFDETPSKEEIDAAAAEADPNPTPAQAEAGNYKKGRFKWNGLDMVIETAKGEERRGTAPDGTEWSVTMPAHYGDIKRTEGADGDPLDFYMGEHPGSNSVTIVNQIDPETGKFDEHKIVLGARDTDEALKIYRAGFSDGSGDKRIGSHSTTDVDSFKGWMKDQDTTKPTDQEPIKSQEPKETEAKPEYGAQNTLVSQDRAKELRERLKAKLRDQINSGIDPEIMAIGAELAVFHIEAGARKFTDLAKAIADDLGTTPAKLKPYLRSWYNGARDMMEDHDVDITGMDDADAVRAALKSGVVDAEGNVKEMHNAPPTEAQIDRTVITDAFHAMLVRGEKFPNINKARTVAKELMLRDLTDLDLKMVEEAFEAAIVRRARELAQDSTDAVSTYDAMVKLYAAQPKLAQRTSTSIEQQAYSTPAPLAYLASRLAGIDSTTTVYEPSAGNGMLMMEAADSNIRANELNEDRHAQITRLYPGAEITRGDAMADNVPAKSIDAVITNPPFGKVKDEERNTVKFDLVGVDGQTTEIDHAIAFKALAAMKDDGRAVLIVGGHQGDATRRRDKYRGAQPRKFYKKLYDTYNVTEHFTVDGKLYARQGAGWPVDVIVIEGRNSSKKPYPMKEAPAFYSSWAELRERLDGRTDNLDPRGVGELLGNDPAAEAEPPADTGSLPLLDGGSDLPASETGSGRGARPDSAGGIPDVGLGSADPNGQPGESGVPSGDGKRDVAQQDSGPDLFSDPTGTDAGRPEGEGQPADGDVQRVPEQSLPVEPRKKPKRENTEAETAFQVQYAPRSAAQFAVGTLVPRNMQDAASRALQALEDRVGNIDAFVAEKLGMTLDQLLGTETTQGAFSAEQVDALALSIDHIEQGKGFIIGDQTGVGKGRINAGLIRYAMRSDKLPVFFTVKPGLYGDMIRDLRDIGEQNPEEYVYMTNDGLRGGKSIPLSEDPADRMSSLPKAQNQKAISDLVSKGELPEGKKVIFTTYDQMNTVKKSVTERMNAIEAIAPQAMFIMDESHEAGGTGGRQKKTADGPEPRSVFIRKLLELSENGVLFSSATFAKNPAVMSLYFKTNLTNAVPNLDKLEDVIERGGVPLQQIISNSLVQDGQYLRRERTYEGIEMKLEQLETDPSLADTSATALREIFDLDQNVMSDVRDSYIENVLSEGGGKVHDGAVGDTGASSVNFSSIMHNAVNQVLLAIKADAVVEQAIEAHKRGEKPIIALSNTNAAIMEDYADEMDISVGDAFDIPFNEILRRYVERLRRITVKDDEDKKTHITLTDADVRAHGSEYALQALKGVEQTIEDADFAGMPASPIDFIRDRLEEAGVSTGEVTGRGKIVRRGTYESRDNSAAANKRAMNEYNSGQLDALIINRSGATGFSLHATARNDGKVRHMFILQPDPNIDTFMQMLGRVNRTGQIVLPKYTIAVSDLAVEKRPAAVLMRKMASLNANTTASKKSAVSLDNVTDFMNRYGDEVVYDYLKENMELAAVTGVRVPGRKREAAGLAAKFTGKLAILAPEQVSAIFDEIEALYTDYLKELDSLGQNALEAKTLELDAKTLNSTVVAEGIDPSSAFGADTVLEDVDVKVLGKPMTPEQLDQQIDKILDGKSDYDHAAEQIRLIDERAPEERKALEGSRERLEKNLKDAKTDKQKDKAADAIRRLEAKLADFDAKVDGVKNLIHQFRPGRSVMVQVRGKGGETVETVYGVTLGIDLSKMKSSITALSRAGTRIALASPARELRVPASRFVGEESNFELLNANDSAVRHAFEDGQAEARERRQIVTGNIIGGVEKFGKGQIVMFTREDGSHGQGILLPKDFDAKRSLQDRPVMFKDADSIIKFLDTAGTVNAPSQIKSDDGTFSANRTYTGYAVTIQRKGGKPYILSPAARDLVGDFTARSGAYRKDVTQENLRKLLEVYTDTLGTEYQAEAHKDEARKITGQELPDFGDIDMLNGAKHKRTEKHRRSVGEIPRSELADLKDTLNTELERMGLKGRATVRAWKQLSAGPIALDGLYNHGEINVSMTATDGPKGTFRHEVIHLLRDKQFWGKDYGLFTKDEWRSLVKEARKRKDLVAQIEADYSELSNADKMEEVIAEMYRLWGEQRDASAPLAKVFQKISAALKAFANALRSGGHTDAAAIFEQIENGQIGGRGPGPRGPGGGARHKRTRQNPGFESGPVVHAKSATKGAKQLVSDALTQAMAGKNGTNLLALVPGRALMQELGGKMPSVKKYLRLKEQMDTLRNERHAMTDELAQRWRKILSSDKEANTRLMDLMHDSTIEGQDPSKPYMKVAEERDPYIVTKYGLNTKTGRDAQDRLDKDAQRKPVYDDLRERFMKLPAAFRDMYADVRDAYDDLANEFESAIEANAEKAMTVAVRRAERAHEKRLEEIRDDGLTGKEKEEAIKEADEILTTAKMQNRWAKNARLAGLRARFESNRLEGPYFPLSRFGDFYATVRNKEGAVVSFSRFEKAREQRKFAEEMKAEGWDVETGVVKEMQARDAVDPGFVADVEGLLEDIDADEMVMDAIWQRWLQTLPDMSMRKSKLHRKGTQGYSGDAFRAFGSQMFHGAHQLARLTYSLDMGEALDVAEQEARHSDSPERNGLIVKEVARRHEYIMNPQGSAWAQTITGAAFVYYLSMTPAAALVNLSQTVIVGIPVLGAYHGKGGQAKASKELLRASQDFARGKAHAVDSKRLTADEKRAMNDAYERGTIDKSQSHDLAGVGETGVEYSPVRTKVMGVISWMFHHAERANREVTFLASYRMAKAKGLDHEKAVEKAADLTWRTHFDYQNTSRPRLLQNDYLRVAMVFRNFQINMLWRLFRDTHQALNGESSAVKAEARRQLAGISAQMLLNAGVKGVWGYSLLKAFAGLFFAGGGDEAEKELEKALTSVLPRDVVGAFLNGVPGHMLGIDLRSRVGMPDLWFRAPDRQLEGEDEYNYWVQQLLGAGPGIVQNVHRGIQQIGEGHVWRGTETIMPKAIRDVMRAGRYWFEGAQTYNGDPIIDEFKPQELIAQVLGFTPARLSERYDANTRLKNEERKILDEKKAIMRDASDAVRAGRGIPESVLDDIAEFNEENPEVAITNKSLNRSIKGRMQASARNEYGVILNQRLDTKLRDDAAPLIYSD